MSDIRERLQCNIISLLKEKNISQKKFAELLGVSQAAVVRTNRRLIKNRDER